MALESCEIAHSARTVSGQYAPVPLTKIANWKQVSSWDQDWPFLTEV